MGAITITDHQVVLGRQCASGPGGVRGSSMARNVSSALYTRLRALLVISCTRRCLLAWPGDLFPYSRQSPGLTEVV